MQYMMMCCIEEKRWEALSEASREAIMRDYGAWVAEAERQGQHRLSARLVSTSSARTVRQRDGHAISTDGPFAETKEQFGGYHLVECRDLDEAVALAMRIPTLPYGGVVEVRAVEAGS